MTSDVTNNHRKVINEFYSNNNLYCDRLNKAEDLNKKEKESNDNGSQKEKSAIIDSIQELRTYISRIKDNFYERSIYIKWPPNIPENIQIYKDLSPRECYSQSISQAKIKAGFLDQSLSQYERYLDLEAKKRSADKIRNVIIVTVVIIIFICVIVDISGNISRNRQNTMNTKVAMTSQAEAITTQNIIATLDSTQPQGSESSKQTASEVEPNLLSAIPGQNKSYGELVTQVANNFATQNAPASREDLDGELSFFSKNPDALASVTRIGDGKHSNNEYDGLYEIKNNSKFSWVTADAGPGCDYCQWSDSYNSTPFPTIDALFGFDRRLFPAGARQVSIPEYFGGSANHVCINVTLSNQTGNLTSTKCFDPLIKINLSQFVQIKAKRLQTSSVNSSGLLEITFEVDKSIPYFPVWGYREYGGGLNDALSISPDPHTEGTIGGVNYSALFKQDTTDNRVLVEADNGEGLLPGITLRYIYLYNNYNPASICFDLFDAYAAISKICSSVE